MIKFIKRLFCCHDYISMGKDYSFGDLYFPKCKKCGLNCGDDLSNHEEKEKYNFSIVKGMAEASRIYNEYYKRNMYRLENFNDSFVKYMYESTYNKIIKERNIKEYEIKCNAEHNSYIAFNEKKEKEEEIENFRLSKMNACYLELKHD
jgi:hypothetical protein